MYNISFKRKIPIQAITNDGLSFYVIDYIFQNRSICFFAKLNVGLLLLIFIVVVCR